MKIRPHILNARKLDYIDEKLESEYVVQFLCTQFLNY